MLSFATLEYFFQTCLMRYTLGQKSIIVTASVADGPLLIMQIISAAIHKSLSF